MRGFNYERIIVDEASKATESRMLLALARKFEGLYLFGDQYQGGPFVHSKQAQEKGMAYSLLERIFAQQNAMEYRMQLRTQFRMAPSLHKGFLDEVYGGLTPMAGIEEAMNKTLGWLKLDYVTKIFAPSVVGSCILAHCETMESVSKRNSRRNMGEAFTCYHLVKLLLLSGIPAQSIKFLSFYEAQVQLFRSMMKVMAEIEWDKKKRIVRTCLEMNRCGLEVSTSVGHLQKEEVEACVSYFGFCPSEYLQIEAATVDSFQGQEGDVTIVSFVRSNVNNKIGFLANRERLVVALSRAKLLRILVGNVNTLLNSGSPEFKSIVEQHFKISAIVDALSLGESSVPSVRRDSDLDSKLRLFKKNKEGKNERKQGQSVEEKELLRRGEEDRGYDIREKYSGYHNRDRRDYRYEQEGHERAPHKTQKRSSTYTSRSNNKNKKKKLKNLI